MKLKFMYISLLMLGHALMHSMEWEPGFAHKINNYAFSLIAPYHKVVLGKTPPAIGVYGGQYPMIRNIARIQLDPEMIKNWLPGALKNALPNYVPDLIFNVQFSRANAQTYNMVFHPWARTWQQNKLFNIMVPMGIFTANGVQPAATGSIAFGQLNPQNVNVHNGNGDELAYSPNNAKFTVSPNRDIVTFWSMAISTNKQHAIVTFHILLTTNAAEDAIQDALGTSNTLGKFLDALQNAADTFARPVDQQALEQTVETIERVLGIAAPPPSLQESLQDLAQQLTDLSDILHKPNPPRHIFFEEKMVQKHT